MKRYKYLLLESDIKHNIIQNIVDYAQHNPILKGLNGNVLVEIRWINTPGEKFSNYEGGDLYLN
jgi:hypothetical protein